MTVPPILLLSPRPIDPIIVAQAALQTALSRTTVEAISPCRVNNLTVHTLSEPVLVSVFWGSGHRGRMISSMAVLDTRSGCREQQTKQSPQTWSLSTVHPGVGRPYCGDTRRGFTVACVANSLRN